MAEIRGRRGNRHPSARRGGRVFCNASELRGPSGVNLHLVTLVVLVYVFSTVTIADGGGSNKEQSSQSLQYADPWVDYTVDVRDTGSGASVTVFGINLTDGTPSLGARLVATVSPTNLTFAAEAVSYTPGAYAISIYVSDLGDYTFMILSCGTDDTCNPISNDVYAFNVGGAISASESFVSGYQGTYTAGESVSFNITAEDSHGIVETVIYDPCPFVVNISSILDGDVFLDYQIVSQGHGIYEVTFVPDRVQVYFVSVMLNGVPIYGGQFSFNTTVDPASAAAKFILTNDGLEQSNTLAAGEHMFSITCTDTKYQVINNLTIVVAPIEDLSHVLYALDCPDSRPSVGCDFELDITVPGNYSVDVYLLGEPLQNAPYILQIVPEMADSVESALLVKYAGVMAGETISYQVVLKDFYGNPASSVFKFGTNFPHLTVGLYSSLPPVYGNISAFLDNFGYPIAGKYLATFHATVAGNFTVVAYFGFSGLNPLTGSGFTLIVSPSLPSAETSFLGSFSNLTVAGSSLLRVYLRDDFNNTVSGSQSVAVMIFNDLLNFTFHCAVVGRHFEAPIVGIFKADEYQVNVSLNGYPFIGGYQLHVFGGTVDPENCSFIGLQDTQAGLRSFFVLQLADQYGNVGTLDADIQIEQYLYIYSPTDDEYADVQITPLSPGFYNVTYTATKAERYVVSFSFGHKQITSELSVLPGALDVRRCSFSGPGTVGGIVNRSLDVHITPRDSYGNRLLLSAVDKSIFEVSGVVKPFTTAGYENALSYLLISPVGLDLRTDTYAFQYSSLVSGSVVLEVAAQGVTYKIESTLNSGPLSIHSTYLSGMGLNGTSSNRSAVFYINAYDVYGNMKDDPQSIGESFRVAICSQSGACSSSSIRVADLHLSEGRYMVTYQAPTSANYTIYVSWYGKDVSGSPLVVPVVDAQVNRLLDPTQFILVCSGLPTSYSCPGLVSAFAGQAHNFTVTAADSRGIPLLTGGELFALSILPDVPLNASLEDVGNGDYVVRYCIYVAGNFTLTLSYHSFTIIVQQLCVFPALTSASKSTLEVPLPITISVGVAFSSAVISLDEFSNEQVYGREYPYSQDRFEIVALKSTGEKISGTIAVADNGSILVSVVASFAGAYNVSVRLNGELISGGSQLVVFEPSAPVVSNSRIIYNNLTVAGESAIIRVFPVDEFGNNLILGLNCSATAINIHGEVFDPPYCELSAHPIQIVYNLTEVGMYLISFSLYDLSGTGFRFTANVTVKSGQPAVQRSGPVDQGGIAIKTGATSTIVINCQDAWGNICTDDYSGLFSVSLWANNFPAVSATLAFEEARIVATYVLYRPGNYSAMIQLAGVPVSANLFTVMASPAPSSALHSFALYGSNAVGALNTSVKEAEITAGTVGNLQVVIVDKYGNRQDKSVADVLNVSFAPACVVPPYLKTGAYAKAFDIDKDHNSDGTYTVSFSANTANYFQINSYVPVKYLLSVGLLGQDGLSYDIAGSPFTFLVTTGPSSAAKSLVRQTESWSGVHGLMWMITLTPKDSFGNAGPFYSILNVTADLAQVTDAQNSDLKFLSDGSVGEEWLSSPGYDGLLEIEQMLQGEENGTNYVIPPMVVDNYNGTYFVYFTVIKCGLYNISIFINNALVGGPLFTIMNYEVMPGAVDMMRLTPTGLGLGYKGTVAGQLSVILLRFTDAFANVVNLSQDGAFELVTNLTASFRVRVWSRSSFVEFPDEDVVAKKNFSVDGDGLLWLFYQPLKSGQLILNLAFTDSVTSLTQEVFGSPFFGTVESGTVLSSNCNAFGPGLHSALACNNYLCPNSSIFLEAHDSYNNLVSSQTSPGICQGFTVIAGPSLTFHTPVPYNGRCLLTYTASKVSTQNIAIQYLWSPIQSSPFQVAVRPTVGDASPRKSLAWGDLGGTITAGTAAIITVKLIDSNGIELYEGPSGTANYVNIVLANTTVGVSSANLISKNNYDGTFTLKLMAFSSGLYAFNILVGPSKLPLGGNIEGYFLRVVSGPTSVSKTITLLVSNQTFYRAGETSVMIEVRAIDKLSNFQDYVMGSSDFYEAHIFQPDGSSIFVPLTRNSTVTDKGVPYQRWVLNFIPLQAPFEGSMYEFQFLWTDGYLRQHIQTKISVPTYPGQALLEHTQVIGQGAFSAFSGLQATFIVQLYDAYHNPIRAESDVLDLNITVILIGHNENIQVNCSTSMSPFGWACSYSVAQTGNYSLQVTFHGTDSKSFPDLTVSPSSAYAASCTASGDGIGVGAPIYAGVPSRFFIEPYDIVHNRIVTGSDFFSVVVVTYSETSSSFVRPQPIYPLWTGTNYEVFYTPVRAGYGEVHVKRGSESIQNSPFAIHVNPGPVSAEHILMRPSTFVSCMAGDMHSLTLVSRDRYDNVRPGGRDIFEVSKHVEYAPDESDVSTMTPLGNGVYQYVYRCQHACSILNPNCTSITVSFGEALVLSTNLRVVPGPVDISKCVAYLFGHTLAAGSEWSVFVVSKDSFGNQLWIGGLDFQTFITFGDTNSSFTAVDNEDGTYLFKYRILKSGNHTIHTSLHGQLFFTDYIEVVPGLPDARATIVAFDPSGYVSGILAWFQIQFYDEFLNYVTVDVLDLSLLLLSLRSSGIPSTMSYPEVTSCFTEGLYNVSFTADHPGILYLSLNVSGIRVLKVNGSSEFSAVVASGPPSISNFVAFGAGIDAGGIVNQAAKFFVHVKDSGENLVSTPPLGTWGLTFSPTNVVAVRPTPFFLQNGTVQFTYIPVRPASDLAITVLYGGQRVGSTKYVKIKTQPGFWSLKHCVALDALGVPLDRSVPLIGWVGTNLTITVQIRDKDGMDVPAPDPTIISLLATVSGVPVAVGPTSAGAFGFTVLNTISGKYVVEISSPDGRQFIRNSGIVVLLLPGPSHPLNTKILTSDGVQLFNSTDALVAGGRTRLQLQAWDQYNNEQLFTGSQTPDIFTASLISLPGRALFGSYVHMYNSGDKHTLYLAPFLSGEYSLTIYLNGEFAGSLRVNVRPAALNFLNFEVSSSELTNVLAGVESSFEITGRDSYYNEAVTWGQICVELQPTDGSASTRAGLFPQVNSTAIVVSFIVPLQGWYDVVVSNATSRMTGNLKSANGTSIRTIRVLAGPIVPSAFLTMLPPKSLTAGEVIKVRFTAFDILGNVNYTTPQVTSDPPYAVEVTSTCSMDTFGELVSCGPYSFSTSFLPTMPGRVNMSLTWNQIVLFTVLQIQPAQQPTMVSARLSDSLTYITVFFDRATDGGFEVEASSLNGSARCSALLDSFVVSKLGTSPSCIFRNPMTLLILLGYNASILPADSESPDFIRLMDNAIYAAEDNSLPVSGSVLLLQPIDPVAPKAKLLAPTSISPCDSLVLDASGSSGSGGRPLMFFYSLQGSGDPEVLVTIGRWLNDIPSSRMYVVINAEMLQAGQSYTFLLTVVNFVGGQSQSSVTVRTTHFAVPLLTTVAADEILVGTRRDLFEIEALASLPVMAVLEPNGSCSPMMTSVPMPRLEYRWSQTDGPILDNSSIIWNARFLTVSGELLKVGFVYNFSVQCSLLGFPMSVSVAHVALSVQSCALSVAIVGGHRTVNLSQNFTLEVDVYDGDNSVDVYGNPYQFNYVWSCDPDLGTNRSPLDEVTAANGFGKKITIPGGYLNSGIYKFSVSVDREPYIPGRVGVTAWVVVTAGVDILTVSTTLDNAAIINLGISPSKQVEVACTVGLVDYKWSVTSASDGRDLLNSSQSVWPVSHRLVIPANILSGGMSYTISCNASSNLGSRGGSSVNVFTMTDPTGGSVDMISDSERDIAGQTLYTLVAHGWTPADGKRGLKYEFRYTLEDGREYVLQPLSPLNFVQNVAVKAGNVTFRAYVANAEGPNVSGADAPAGALYELPSITVGVDAVELPSSYTETSPPHVDNALYYNFLTLQGQGEYLKALCLMEIFGSLAIPKSPQCSRNSSVVPVVNQMLAMVEASDWQYPPPYISDTVAAGSGPYIAVALACALVQIFQAPGNVEPHHLNASVSIFEDKLALVAANQLSATAASGQAYNPCFLDAVDTLVNAVYSSCTGAPQSLIERASQMPLMLARILLNDKGFLPPNYVVRPSYSLVWASVDLLPDMENNLTCSVANFRLTASSWSGEGTLGAAVACFPAFAPLSTWEWEAMYGYGNVIAIFQICDLALSGVEDTSAVSLVVSYFNLVPAVKNTTYAIAAVNKGLVTYYSRAYEDGQISMDLPGMSSSRLMLVQIASGSCRSRASSSGYSMVLVLGAFWFFH